MCQNQRQRQKFNLPQWSINEIISVSIALEDTSKEVISEEIVINIKPSLPEIILSDEVTYETKIVEPGLLRLMQ